MPIKAWTTLNRKAACVGGRNLKIQNMLFRSFLLIAGGGGGEEGGTVTIPTIPNHTTIQKSKNLFTVSYNRNFTLKMSMFSRQFFRFRGSSLPKLDVPKFDRSGVLKF